MAGEPQTSACDQRDLIPWALFLLPVLIGVVFWGDTSCHADSFYYRSFVRTLYEDGRLELVRMEWHHPGHNLMVLPVYAVCRWLTGTTDALASLLLVNFAMMGWLAVDVYRTARALFPDRGQLAWATLGCAVATCPGWLMACHLSMSDVVGHALVCIVTMRLIRHHSLGESRGSALLITGFLFTWSGLVRVSSGLFLPLMLFALLRLLHHLGWRSPSARRCLLFFGIGALVPAILVFGYFLLRFGLADFTAIYFDFTEDNNAGAERWRALPRHLRLWGRRLYVGLGPVLLFGGLAVLLRGVVRSRLVLISLILLLPYLYGVAMNRAAYEFRYQLPVMLWLSVGAGAWALFLPRGRQAVLLVLVIAVSLTQATPMLNLFRTRDSFVEATAEALVNRASSDALLIGCTAWSAIEFHQTETQRSIIVRKDQEVGGIDFWSRDWPSASDVVAHQLRGGRDVWIGNDAGVAGFRAHLRAMGVGEEVEVLTSIRVRNFEDPALHKMEAGVAAREGAVELVRLLPPAVWPKRVVGLASKKISASEYRLSVIADAYPGTRYMVLIGKATPKADLDFGPLRLPFAKNDKAVEACVLARESLGLRGFAGHLDAAGRAEAFAPAALIDKAENMLAVVVLFDSDGSLDSARTASQPIELR